MRLRSSAVLTNSLFVLGFILFSKDLACAITYTYTGSCTVACASIGLPAGGFVSGAVTFTDSSLVGGNPYPPPTSFFFDFGTVDIDSASALQFFIAGLVPVDLNIFSNSQSVTEAISPATGDTIFTNSNPPWSAGSSGACTPVPGQCVIVGAASGSGQWHRVPEPSTFVMLLVGLLCKFGIHLFDRFHRNHIGCAGLL
jgi:hypothetical protein